jgi:UDP-N-acetylmuramoylalanine--D-glutamate ligase
MSSAIDRFIQDFSGKKVLIFGLGILGRGVGDAKFFHHIGSRIRITDLKQEPQLTSALDQLKGIQSDYIFGEHRPQDIDWADIILRNAAVPWDHPLLNRARDQQKPIYMDTQLFVQYSGVEVLGITGTRGKSTTTHMAFKCLNHLPQHQILLGGNAINDATLPLLEKIKSSAQTIAVLELSSWQLQAFSAHRLSPQSAVITNVYPDHLNTYPNYAAYLTDKQAIYKYQQPKDWLLLNHHQSEFHQWAKSAPSQIDWFKAGDLPAVVKLKVPGQHNRLNAAAALKTALHYGVSQTSVLNTLSQFTGLPHRLEKIRTVNHVSFINDSTSTTPIATITALNAIKPPLVLILGGTDKKLPVKDLAQAINQHSSPVVLISGNGTDRVKPLINPGLIKLETNNLKEAVLIAQKIAPPHSTVLLSPGFTSFGIFNNEFDRGKQFTQIVNIL